MHRLACIAILLFACVTRAQEEGIPVLDAAPDAQPEVHWAIRLGLRVERVDRSFPLVDRVVLVPDAATYVDELAKWSPRGRWPVLIEDDFFAPMFIARFDPARVVRRESVGALPPPGAARRALLEGVVVRAWGSNPRRHDAAGAFERQGFTPPGVVVASDADPAWTAAVGLAAGRGQPLVWLDEPYGSPDEELGLTETQQLLARIDALVDSTGYPHDELGDAIDAITVCRAIAGRAEVELPPANRLDVPNFGWRNPLAITDLIGRTSDGGPRYAVTGWIFGDETRCAYVAMCSLFLPRERVWFFNTYPDHGDWLIYRVDEAEQLLGKAGFRTTAFRRDQTTYAGWRHLLPFGFPTDVLAVNSKGNPDIFELNDGKVGNAGDVPTLSSPLAVHFIHSWSMHAPDDPGTIAAQWIDHGAYAYVGSVAEPLLAAFIPPSELAKRWVRYVPFLVAARHYAGPFSRPWKVNAYGDPLMLCAPPAAHVIERIEGPPHGGEELGALAKTLLLDSAHDETGETLAEAIRTLNLLGRYDVAVRAWKLAVQRGVPGPAARPALTALYHRHDVDGFLRAWERLRERDDRAIDMLWHLAAPEIASTRDPQLLNHLGSSIRPSQPVMDVSLLAPAILRVFGHGHMRLIVQQQLDRTNDRVVRRELERLLDDYRQREAPPSVGERFTRPPRRGS